MVRIHQNLGSETVRNTAFARYVLRPRVVASARFRGDSAASSHVLRCVRRSNFVSHSHGNRERKTGSGSFRFGSLVQSKLPFASRIPTRDAQVVPSTRSVPRATVACGSSLFSASRVRAWPAVFGHQRDHAPHQKEGAQGARGNGRRSHSVAAGQGSQLRCAPLHMRLSGGCNRHW